MEFYDTLLSLSPVFHARLGESLGDAYEEVSATSFPVAGTPDYGQAGPFKRALNETAISFGGSGALINFGDLSAVKYSNAYTEGIWVKLVSGSTGTRFLMTKDDNDVARCHALLISNSGMVARAIFFSEGEIREVNGITNLDDGRYHLVIVRYTGTFFSIWVDGVKETEVAATGTVDNFSTNFMIAGRDSNPVDSSAFTGKDSFAFDRDLSDTEIKSLCVPLNGVLIANSTDTLVAGVNSTKGAWHYEGYYLSVCQENQAVKVFIGNAIDNMAETESPVLTGNDSGGRAIGAALGLVSGQLKLFIIRVTEADELTRFHRYDVDLAAGTISNKTNCPNTFLTDDPASCKLFPSYDGSWEINELYGLTAEIFTDAVVHLYGIDTDLVSASEGTSISSSLINYGEANYLAVLASNLFVLFQSEDEDEVSSGGVGVEHISDALNGTFTETEINLVGPGSFQDQRRITGSYSHTGQVDIVKSDPVHGNNLYCVGVGDDSEGGFWGRLILRARNAEGVWSVISSDILNGQHVWHVSMTIEEGINPIIFYTKRFQDTDYEPGEIGMVKYNVATNTFSSPVQVAVAPHHRSILRMYSSSRCQSTSEGGIASVIYDSAIGDGEDSSRALLLAGVTVPEVSIIKKVTSSTARWGRGRFGNLSRRF